MGVPRAAFSHCASVGSVTLQFSFSPSQLQNATASYHLTMTTGWFGKSKVPPRLSGSVRWPFHSQPAAVQQRRHLGV